MCIDQYFTSSLHQLEAAFCAYSCDQQQHFRDFKFRVLPELEVLQSKWESGAPRVRM